MLYSLTNTPWGVPNRLTVQFGTITLISFNYIHNTYSKIYIHAIRHSLCQKQKKNIRSWPSKRSNGGKQMEMLERQSPQSLPRVSQGGLTSICSYFYYFCLLLFTTYYLCIHLLLPIVLTLLTWLRCLIYYLSSLYVCHSFSGPPQMSLLHWVWVWGMLLTINTYYTY